MPLFLPDYNCVPIHKLMLADANRVSAYCAAVRERTRNASVVVDLGCGAGILSLAAARAGARRVYGIEKSRIASVAERVFADNGLADAIQLIRADSMAVELPERADLLVSEWMGVHVLQEDMLLAMCDARERLLRPGGKIIPERVDMWLAPIRRNPVLENEIRRWRVPIEGFDFSEVLNLSLNETYIGRVRPVDLTHAGIPVHRIDLYTVKPHRRMEIGARFQFERADTIEGLCGWFVAQLTTDIRLDTGPGAPLTHWQQAVYPCYPPLDVEAGDALETRVLFEPSAECVEVTWVISVDEKGIRREYSTKSNYTLPDSRSAADRERYGGAYAGGSGDDHAERWTLCHGSGQIDKESSTLLELEKDRTSCDPAVDGEGSTSTL